MFPAYLSDPPPSLDPIAESYVDYLRHIIRDLDGWIRRADHTNKFLRNRNSVLSKENRDLQSKVNELEQEHKEDQDWNECLDIENNELCMENDNLVSMVDHLILGRPPNDNNDSPEDKPTAYQQLISALDKKEYPTTEELEQQPKTGILSLPSEILEIIFQYLPDDLDLAQVCKVNRRFFATALPWLYRTLEIQLRSEIDTGILQLLTQENTGLRFVRKVFLRATSSWKSQSTMIAQFLRILVNHLPRNRLKVFSFCGIAEDGDVEPIPWRVLKVLWERQRFLEELEILPEFNLTGRWIPSNGDLKSLVKKVGFPKLEKVYASLSHVESANTVSAALQCGKVTKLEIDGLLWKEKEAAMHRDDDSSSENDPPPSSPESEVKVEDKMTEQIFAHLHRVKPGYTPTYRDLTSLCLKDIDLTLSRYTWFTYLNLVNLRELKLEYCKGADLFLLRLVDIFPPLQSFTLVHYVAAQADRTIHAVEELLQGPQSKFETLQLCLRNTSDVPGPAHIGRHGRTLTKLIIDIAKERPKPSLTSSEPKPKHNPQKYTHDNYTRENFEALIFTCKNLKELAIAIPPPSIDFATFSASDDACRVFVIWTDLIVRNLQLSVLNILNWPTGYKYGKTIGYYTSKNLSVARLAAEIFKRHGNYDRDENRFDDANRHTALQIVAFGTKEHSVQAPERVNFMQCTVETLGVKTFHAEEICDEVLKTQALYSGILAHAERNFEKACRKRPHTDRYSAGDEGDDF